MKDRGMQSISTDIGCSAVKLAPMDETAAARLAGYRLHNGDAVRALRGLMDEAAAGFPTLRVGWTAVTGSGGRREHRCLAQRPAPDLYRSRARPVLNRTFDEHQNADDANRLEAFLGYLWPKHSLFSETA